MLKCKWLVILGLKKGLNIIKIKVTSEDKTQNKEYTIQVTKTDNLESANTNLETLAIENTLLTPPFENRITQYNTQISNQITKLNILAIPENENSKIEIIGNDNLKEGNNQITIAVTATNGVSKRIYQINVYQRNKQEEEQYQKEQEENAEKLKQAYEIEKLSTINEGGNSKELQKKKNRTYIMTGSIIVAITMIIIGIIYYKKRKGKLF